MKHPYAYDDDYGNAMTTPRWELWAIDWLIGPYSKPRTVGEAVGLKRNPNQPMPQFHAGSRWGQATATRNRDNREACRKAWDNEPVTQVIQIQTPYHGKRNPCQWKYEDKW